MSVDRDALWLDDIRRPPSSFWKWARTLDDAKMIINTCNVLEASLDHDLGLHDRDPDDYENSDVMRVSRDYRHSCGFVDVEAGLNSPQDFCQGCGNRTMSPEWSLVPEPDGVEFAKWLVEEGKVPPMIVIHSMNNVGARNMYEILKDHANVVIKPFHRW